LLAFRDALSIAQSRRVGRKRLQSNSHNFNLCGQKPRGFPKRIQLFEVARGGPRKLDAPMNDFTSEERAAAETAASILQADPSTGPVDVIYLDPKRDVFDARYLILLFQGERGFLFDNLAGKTSTFELEVEPLLSGEARLQAKIARAKVEAARLKLGKLYVVR